MIGIANMGQFRRVIAAIISQCRRFPETRLALYGFLLSLLWELGHSVLYLDHARDLSYVIWTRFHCSLGDVLILLGSFWWTSLWFRTRFWFAGDWRFPAVVFVFSGLAYTAWSEWYNT